MSEIKVFGHINPDTDSVASPIVYAWYLSQIKKIPAKAYIANEPNREALYLIQRFGFTKPETLGEFTPEDKIVIIDTNNADELKSGFEIAQILEIIDHHKFFGNISTAVPIKVTMKPVACVATILWQIIKVNSTNNIPANVAGLLLGAILSDTLKFTSPTTTQEDRDAANELVNIAILSVDELATSMFEAKSDLTGMTPDDVLHMDSKIFELSGKKVRISVLETTSPDKALETKSAIVQRMSELKQEESLDMIFFYIVDILNSSSEVLVTNTEEKTIIEKAYKTSFTGDSVTLPGIVSRKKQMVPNIEIALQ